MSSGRWWRSFYPKGWLWICAAVSVAASEPPAEVEFLQPLPIIELPSSARFATATVLLRNRGGRLLRIGSVRSSCWCATAVVQRGEVPPDSLSVLRIQVTAAGLDPDSLTWLQFTLESNACNSPTPLRLAVRRRQ